MTDTPPHLGRIVSLPKPPLTVPLVWVAMTSLPSPPVTVAGTASARVPLTATLARSSRSPSRTEMELMNRVFSGGGAL